jgi:hypothetical protein
MDNDIGDAASLYSLDSDISDPDDENLPTLPQTTTDPDDTSSPRPTRHDLGYVCAENDPRRALHVPELFDLIAQNLKYRDLLRCHSVCRQWRHVLSDTYPLAYDAFLKPINSAPFTPLSIQPSLPPKEGWWLKELYRNCLNGDEECSKPSCITNTHLSVIQSYINPLFADLALNKETCLRVDGHTATFIVFEPEHIGDLLRLHRCSAPQAIWRKTFLTNPPVRTVRSFSDIPGDRIEDEDGVKVGSVVEHLADMFEREEKKWTMERPEAMDLWAARRRRISAWSG